MKHKFIWSVVILLIIGGGYYGYKSFFTVPPVTKYVVSKAQKGSLIVSVSGSGQVAVSDQVSVKSKVSGDVTFVGAKDGQEVKSGAVIVKLDTRDIQKTVRDAEANLESAKISLAKLQTPPDALSILQAENALTQANESKQTAEDDLRKAREDGFNSVSSTFLDLPTVMAGLSSIFFSSTIDKSQDNITWYLNQTSYDNNERYKAMQYKDDVYNAYTKARADYDKNFETYRLVSRSSDAQVIESMISETYNTVLSISDAVKISNNYIDFIRDALAQHNASIPAIMTTHKASLDSYTKTINTHLSDLLSLKHTIQIDREAIVDVQRTINEKNESLLKLKSGPDVLDVQSSELAIKQRENALLDAKEKLADYTIYSPFNGVLTNFDIRNGDSISASTILSTLITKQKIAEISLNEVDAVKVKKGQKATLTFDAIPDFVVTGQVADIDSVGAVTQGVVTYVVKIAFDTQDERIKPAMSVSAAIIVDAKSNVLLIPNSAIKVQGQTNYVEIADTKDVEASATSTSNGTNGIILKTAPRRQEIQIGISNDENTEGVSGVNEGDYVITQTIQPSAQVSATQQQSGGLRIPGLGGGGGARVR